MRGLRVWPGIALGAFLVNVPLGPSNPAVLAIASGNTLAPVCSYALLRRTEFRTELDRLQDAPGADLPRCAHRDEKSAR
ncbi:hypothetical protein [Streptomyces sp. NBC_01565]|uniref:hypothetical protein n=1 Tax=unclassified Streptomyces TaxID=2593676 RepID=UPI002B1CDC28|nr:hypothetical protein [Streptomyces sp. NBC_01565]